MILGFRLQAVSATGQAPAFTSIAGQPGVEVLPPFHSWGLVFGLRDEEGGGAAEIGRTNLPGDMTGWAANDLPWGSASDATDVLASRVVRFLRPDWKASFWSREYFEEVACDFAHRFLVPAPRAGGAVTRQQINTWLESLGLAASPLPTSVRLVSSVR